MRFGLLVITNDYPNIEKLMEPYRDSEWDDYDSGGPVERQGGQLDAAEFDAVLFDGKWVWRSTDDDWLAKLRGIVEQTKPTDWLTRSGLLQRGVTMSVAESKERQRERARAQSEIRRRRRAQARANQAAANQRLPETAARGDDTDAQQFFAAMIEFGRHCLAEDGDVVPTLIADDGQSQRYVIPTPWRDDDEKQMMLAQLPALLRQRRCIRYFWLCTGWAVDDSTTVRPSQSERRIEVLIVSYADRGAAGGCSPLKLNATPMARRRLEKPYATITAATAAVGCSICFRKTRRKQPNNCREPNAVFE